MQSVISEEMDKSKVNSDSYRNRLQHAVYLYGYIEVVGWGIITGLAGLLALFVLISGPESIRPHVYQKIADTYFAALFIIIVLLVLHCGAVHVIFGVLLSKGIKHQSSRAVLSYFIFGIITNILRVGNNVVLIACSGISTQQKYIRIDISALGFGIAGLIFCVLYCGILWTVFRCYQQIKSDSEEK